MTRDGGVGPAGHPVVQEKDWSVFHCNTEAQSHISTPVKSNICPNLTQAPLITHSAWAGEK